MGEGVGEGWWDDVSGLGWVLGGGICVNPVWLGGLIGLYVQYFNSVM